MGLAVVFTNVSFTVASAPLAAALLMPDMAALVHEKVVPAVALVAVYENAVSSQTSKLVALLSIGVGLTVTVTFWVVAQPFAVSVKMYTTSIGLAVVLINVSFTVSPDPLATALLIPDTAARVHEKPVPGVALVAV